MARQEACDPWSRLTKLRFAQMSYHLIGEVRTLFLLVVQKATIFYIVMAAPPH